MIEYQLPYSAEEICQKLQAAPYECTEYNYVFEKQVLTFSDQSSEWPYSDNKLYGTTVDYVYADHSWTSQNNLGKIVKVLWDGVEYNCKYQEPSTSETALLGNAHLWDPDKWEDTGEPFFIAIDIYYGSSGLYFRTTDASTQHTIAIYGDEAILTTHKLADKYIPETIARLEDVSEFTISVSGDEAEGYILDRTFQEIQSAFANGKTISCILMGIRCPLLFFDESQAVFALNLGSDSATIFINSDNFVDVDMTSAELTIDGQTYYFDQPVDFTDTINNMIDTKIESAVDDYLDSRTHYDTIITEYVCFDEAMGVNSNVDRQIVYNIPVGTYADLYINGNLQDSNREGTNAGDSKTGFYFMPGLYMVVDNSNKSIKVSNYEFWQESTDVKIILKNLSFTKQLDDKYIPDTVVRKTELENMSLKLLSPSGKTFQISVNDDGTLSTTELV